jgi:pimeloyl-ACP methyl ester carboxylesterase
MIKTAAVTVLGLALGFGVYAGAPSALGTSAPPVPALNWTSCYDGFQCATARVPLDYRHPDASEQISIAVIRHLAADPAQRLGSLFVNGGGPSAQVDTLASSYQAIPAAIRARYDIIDFDPRGFGASTSVQCFPDLSAEIALFSRLNGIPYPVGTQQISLWDQTWAAFDARCARSAGPVLYHDTTADVARDMDLLRQAVGDPVLNYWGLSYGTGLGATYANLFPGKVGHMVLDGNLDPVAWTTDYSNLPTWLRTGQDIAAAAVLRDFLDLCGQTSTTACAFSAGSPAATRAKFATLLNRLHQHPVTIDGQTYSDVRAANSVPVSSVSAWQDGATVLQQLWDASAGAVTGSGTINAGTTNSGEAKTSKPIAPSTAAAGDTTAYAGQEQLIATQCADSPNPRDTRAYPAAAQLAYDRSDLVGPPLAWSTESCAAWPAAAAQDRYAGPWNRPTASTILVVGNTGDPVTPYQSSVAMSRDLARARLLTVRGYGHTAFLNPSTCATNYEISYLLTGSLPPAGTSCPQDAVPFP